MEIEKLWAVEYDPLEQTVTIENVEEILRMNRKRICLGQAPDRVLLGIYSTSEEAMEARQRVGKLLDLDIVYTLP